MILIGDVLEGLRSLPDNSVQCVVTSPPYWGLRDYGVDGQIGLEKTPQEFVARLVEVFREVRRVLKADGVCWVNLGDSYAGYHGNKNATYECAPSNKGGYFEGQRESTVGVAGLKPKDLVGIPWRVAFALQDDGWYLRSDVIWSKPNPMPESVTDRPTKAHEYIFLLTKNAKYFYDADAIRTEHLPATLNRWRDGGEDTFNTKYSKEKPETSVGNLRNGSNPISIAGANARTVWTIATQAYPEAHFATFPEEIPRRCIMAGSREGDTVLDPFLGSGTTAAVAVRLGRKWIGCELNPEYAELARKRIAAETPSMFSEVA